MTVEQLLFARFYAVGFMYIISSTAHNNILR